MKKVSRFLIMCVLILSQFSSIACAKNWPDMKTAPGSGSKGSDTGSSSSSYYISCKNTGTKYTLEQLEGGNMPTFSVDDTDGFLGNTVKWINWSSKNGKINKYWGVSNPKVEVGDELFKLLLSKKSLKPSDVINEGKSRFRITAEVMIMYTKPKGRLTLREASSKGYINWSGYSGALWKIVMPELGSEAMDTSEGVYYLPVILHKDLATGKLIKRTTFEDFSDEPVFKIGTSTKAVAEDYKDILNDEYKYVGISVGSNANAKTSPDTAATTISTDENNLYVTLWYKKGPSTTIYYKDEDTNKDILPPEPGVVGRNEKKDVPNYEYKGVEEVKPIPVPKNPDKTYVDIPKDDKDHEIIFWYKENKQEKVTVYYKSKETGADIGGPETVYLEEEPKDFNENGVQKYNKNFVHVETKVDDKSPTSDKIVTITPDGKDHTIIFYYKQDLLITVKAVDSKNNVEIKTLKTEAEKLPLKNKSYTYVDLTEEGYDFKDQYTIDYTTNAYTGQAPESNGGTAKLKEINEAKAGETPITQIVILFYYEKKAPTEAIGNVKHIYRNPLTNEETLLKADSGVWKINEDYHITLGSEFSGKYINDAKNGSPVIMGFECGNAETHDDSYEYGAYVNKWTQIKNIYSGDKLIEKKEIPRSELKTYYRGFDSLCPNTMNVSEKTTYDSWTTEEAYNEEKLIKYEVGTTQKERNTICELPETTAKEQSFNTTKYNICFKPTTVATGDTIFRYTDQYVNVEHRLVLETESKYKVIGSNSMIIPVNSSPTVPKYSDSDYKLIRIDLNGRKVKPEDKDWALLTDSGYPVPFINGMESQKVIFYYKLIPTDGQGENGGNGGKGTPVVCNVPEKNHTVKLDETFTITIPNKGVHKLANERGYSTPVESELFSETKSWNEYFASGKYASFDMDVEYNGKVYSAGENILLVARTKSAEVSDKLRDKFTFTVPVWVKDNATYTGKIWVAPTGSQGSIAPNPNWNLIAEDNSASGIATDEITITVQGKIYDFTVTNIQGDDEWKKMLSLPSLKDVAGEYKSPNIAKNDKNLPIAQETERSNKKYNYALKKGTKIFFSVNTKGISNESVKLTPKFYYISKDGKTREEIDVFSRNAKGTYTKLANITMKRTSNTNNSNKLTQEFTQERQKAILLYNTVKYNVNADIGTYSNILLNSSFKFPYMNYLKEEGKKWTPFKSNEEIVKNVSHWYGDYTLPSDANFAKKGTANPSNKDFNKYVDGYVILLFKLESQTGKSTYLKYDDVWAEEGMTNQYVAGVQLPKISVNGTSPVIGTTATSLLADGYAPVAIYQANISTNQNYDTSGTH